MSPACCHLQASTCRSWHTEFVLMQTPHAAAAKVPIFHVPPPAGEGDADPGEAGGHQGIRAQLIGQIELAAEQGQPHDFVLLGEQHLSFRAASPLLLSLTSSELPAPACAQPSEVNCQPACARMSYMKPQRTLVTDHAKWSALLLSAGQCMHLWSERTRQGGRQQSAHQAGWRRLQGYSCCIALSMWCRVQLGPLAARGPTSQQLLPFRVNSVEMEHDSYRGL